MSELAFDYAVLRSDRARRVRVRVDAETGVAVVLPRRAPERAAQAAILELRPWIERRLAELDRARAEIERRAGRLPYLDDELELVPERGRSRVHQRGARLLVPPGDARPAIERWYRRAARREIGDRLDAATEETGTSYSSLTIRGQRTRWASCSADGAMSFNWRLLLAPAHILDYVVWHEVCHLDVLDHSPRFWSLLAARWPEYRAHAAWLRRHGATLAL